MGQTGSRTKVESSPPRGTAGSRPRFLPDPLVVALLVPAALSSLVLAAHYTRSFQPHFMFLFLGLPLLLFVARPWAARIVQFALLFGAFEWVTTTLLLVGERRASGEDYGRMVVILLGVAAFTLLSAALLEAPRSRRRFGLRTERFFR